MPREGLLVLMFDLPTKTREERKIYGKFRRSIKKKGYLMMQESVYIKHLHNTANFDSELKTIDSLAPQKGEIAVIQMSLNQFQDVNIVRGTGSKFNKIHSSVIFV